MSHSGMRSRLSQGTLLLCALFSCGCADLGIPRIDPTGERIFLQPPPIAAVPQVRAEPGPPMPWNDVAVEISPQLTVAPVGSEVVLLAAVRGPDHYLRTNRRLEWSLAPGGVGYFVAVGRSGPVDLLLGDFNWPRKVDNTFAIGSTSRDYLRLDRGTATSEDDVCVLSGQGWITLASPIEGISHVTVFAPDVHAWESRTQTAVIHWVDAQWGFPPPAINPAGTAHVFTTTVMRCSDQTPCTGWLVRYEIVDGPAAGFAPDGTTAIEVATNAAGQASVEIFQEQPGPGTNQIAIQIIRPAALGGPNGKRLLVGSGSTLKTWTAPALAVRINAPQMAEVGSTLSYRIEVSNPGDQPAEEVLLSDELPEGLSYLESTPPAQLTGRTLKWPLGQLGAGQCRAIELNCRVVQAGSVTNCGGATAAGGLKANDCATTTVVVPTVDVQLSGPSQATLGSQITFHVLVTNRGPVPARGLLIKDRFPPGMEHAAAPSPIERELGDLAVGETQQIDVTFRVTTAGRLCHTVEVTGPGGVQASAEACLTAVAAAPDAAAAVPSPLPAPAPPSAVTIKKSLIREPSISGDTGAEVQTVGEMVRFAIEITNTGSRTLSNLELLDQYDPSLFPRKATPGFRFVGNDLVCTIASLPAGKTEQLEVLCECLQPARRACNRATVTTQDGIQTQDEACLQIRAVPGNLTITVADTNDPVAVGKVLTYEIRVANLGPTPQRQVTVVATVPEGMVPEPSGTIGPGETKAVPDGQTIRFDPVPEIRPGEILTYRISVLTQKPGKQLVLRTELTAQNMPQPQTAEETTEVFQ